jgi:SAM-dependent methyltransferase
VTQAPPRDHIARNRRFWDDDSDAYQEVHGADLAARPLAWGAWRRPESELGVLGDVRDQDMLELGCGGAQWSAALTSAGARATGLDLSAAQLRHAQSHCAAQGANVPLVHASGESLPFAANAFDIVFCDHGALSFCDPERTLPEVARVLRPEGMLAFCATHPLVYLTWSSRHERQSRKLHMDYDQLGRIAFADGTIDWVLPSGEWIALLRAHGFDVELLLELSPPADATTTYDEFVPDAWAHHWPAEQIWRARLR